MVCKNQPVSVVTVTCELCSPLKVYVENSGLRVETLCRWGV